MATETRSGWRNPIQSLRDSKFMRDLSNLFFFKRRPRWNVPKEWTRPSEEAYKEAMHWEGFISLEYWEDDDLTEYPLIMQDLQDLEEHLLPIFWDFDQKARHYQNNFYFYQWFFILGAFGTTTSAVLTTYFQGLDAEYALTVVNALALLTLLISLITTYAATMIDYGEPRKRWNTYRRLSEELRMTYFKFLSHLEPFNGEDRVDLLRSHVLEIRRKEKDNG